MYRPSETSIVEANRQWGKHIDNSGKSLAAIIAIAPVRGISSILSHLHPSILIRSLDTYLHYNFSIYHSWTRAQLNRCISRALHAWPEFHII